MGIRKQPFGYRVEMGEIVLHPQEAKLVEYIFQQYLSGASFNTLVAQLREQSIPYDEGKLWNKNMVARILEDRRYTGEGGYPAITDQETLSRVLEKRSSKQAPAQKTEAQKLLRRLSGHTATEQMERQVLNLLNGLITSPERITLPESGHLPQTPEQALKRELDTVMDQQPIDEDAAQKLILAIAAAQYSAINPNQYETIRPRRLLSKQELMTELDAELLQSSVSAILCYRDGTMDTPSCSTFCVKKPTMCTAGGCRSMCAASLTSVPISARFPSWKNWSPPSAAVRSPPVWYCRRSPS